MNRSVCWAWAVVAMLAAPAVRASTVSNIEAVWQEGMITNKRWLKKFVSESVIGAAAA